MEGFFALLPSDDTEDELEPAPILVSMEQRGAHDDTLLEQIVTSFTDERAFELALCRELCGQLEEYFYDEVSQPLPAEDPRAQLMYYNWRQQMVYVRDQYRHKLTHLLWFATTYMRTPSNKHPLLSIVAHRSRGSTCTLLINIH
jgi:hypothetical protein